ncbi:MAG: hypothetical protein ACR2OH_07300 [Microthrixaceae bacterium]
MHLTVNESPPAERVDDRLPDDLVWVGRGAKPNASEINRAVAVMAAVPLAGAAGWSVNGHPWSCHPRRLRTAIVRPTGEWNIKVMRAVREVDCLAGPMVVRVSHLDRLEPSRPPEHGVPGTRWRSGKRSDDSVRALSRALRGSGFRLLLLGEP